MNVIITQSMLKKALLERKKKSQDLKKKTWQEFDKKVLTTIQIFLANEVLDEFSIEKTASSLWERL